MMSTRQHTNMWRRFRVSRVGVAMGIVAFLVLGGTGAFAYWSVGAALSTSASAGTLSVTAVWTSSLGETFANNGAPITGAKIKTGEVTVRNTTTTGSTLAMPYTVTLGYTGASPGPLATKLAVTVWKKSASCGSVDSPSFTGTWASPPAISGTLVATDFAVWCVRTAVAERSDLASANDSVSLTPKVSATLTAGSQWTTSSTDAPGALQKAEFVYPAFTPPPAKWYRIHLATNSALCLDILGSGGVNTELIEWSCTANPNQQFQISGADALQYLAVTPRHAQSYRWDTNGSTTIGSGVKLQSASASVSQAWQLQQASAGVYQIVNKNSGLCIAPGPGLPTGQTPYVQVLCSGATAQQFTLETVRETISLTCAETGGSWSSADVRFSWDAANAGAYTFQADDNGWKTIGTSSANATDILITGTQPSGSPLERWSSGTYPVRMVDSQGAVVGQTSIDVEWWRSLRCD